MGGEGEGGVIFLDGFCEGGDVFLQCVNNSF